jgi:antitoxin ParD1/3/4
MSLELSQELEMMVQTILRTGQYQSESEVLHEALGLLSRRDDLRKDLQAGMEEIDRGEGIDGDQVIQDLEDRAARLAQVDR